MSIGQAVAAGFRNANEGWKVIAVSWILGLVMMLSQRVLLPAKPASPEANPVALIVGGIGLIVFALGVGVLWTVWLGGALVWLKNRLDGSENSWPGFIEGGKRLFWGLCWVMSLQVILGVAPPLIAGLIAALLARAIGGAATILLIVAGILIGIAVFILLTFGMYSLAEKQQGAKVALSDSARFVRAHPAGTVGLLAVLLFVGMAMVLAVVIPLLLLAFLLKIPVSMAQQQQLPLVADIPLQAMTAYVFFFVLAAEYAYYRGNPSPGDMPIEEARS